jgi:hypothetical protein
MTQKELDFLQSFQHYPSVSIYAPMHVTMPEREKDPIVIKNLVQEAKDRLLKEFSQHDLKSLFQRLDDLVRQIDYTHAHKGIAIFVNESYADYYQLPFHVEQDVVIDKTFVTRYLLYAKNRDVQYWVLVLGEKPTRLYYGIGESISEVVEPPTNTKGVPEDGFPFQYTAPAESVVSQALEDGEKDSGYLSNYKRRFFENVDDLLHRFVSVEPLPIIVLGTQRNIAYFDHCTKQKKYIVGHVEGDYTDSPKSRIENRLAPVIEEYLHSRIQQKIQAFSDAVGAGRHEFGLNPVWRVALEGRVQDLLVVKGYAVGGKINPENETDLIIYDDAKSPGICDDLVNRVIELVVKKGGSVTFIEAGDLPEEYGEIAAILRY